jgi:hypothetical protein
VIFLARFALVGLYTPMEGIPLRESIQYTQGSGIPRRIQEGNPMNSHRVRASTQIGNVTCVKMNGRPTSTIN